MGYGYYTLPDGREAGYAVVAQCDAVGCAAQIYRGIGYLCGDAPDGHRDPEDSGCGRYFCAFHHSKHDCPNPECGAEDIGLDYQCTLAKGHEAAHCDKYEQIEYSDTHEEN